MEIQSASAHAAYSYPNILSNQKQAPAEVRANSSASGATISDTVDISQAARNRLAEQSDSAAASGNGTRADFDTNQGSGNPDIDAYFSPSGSADGGAPLSRSLPPLLLPTRNTIDALTDHISGTFQEFLADNNIPHAPSSITYDSEGQIQLPSDYAYASELKQALANNPTMANELSTVNALSSHFVAMRKTASFRQDYAAAATQAEINAVVARYGHLFSGNDHYGAIALQFSPDGRLSITHDGNTLT